MKSKRIDLLNIGLIIVSLIVAYILPFRLFLFSYAVLGPLHYLTEINWLKQNDYFIKHKAKWNWPFIVAASLMALYPISHVLGLDPNGAIMEFFKSTADITSVFVLFAFIFALGLIISKKRSQLIYLLIIAIILAFLMGYLIPKAIIIVGLFLPTLIHVFLFTLLFMLYGSRKSASMPGYLASFLLLLVPFVIMYLPLNPRDYIIGQGTIDAFIKSNMVGVTKGISDLMGANATDEFKVFSKNGFKIQIFISFAYTYHYLNWFSKTSVIGWKNSLNKKRIYWIAGLWILSVVLYASNYSTGFVALFFLSFLHVFLEFPLNVITIKALFSKN